MKEIHREPIPLELVADLLHCGIKRRPSSPRNRSVWHVTNLIASADLISKGDVRYHEYVGVPVGIMSLGRIWESAIDCYLVQWATERGGAYIPDVEQCTDGVVASLDGVVVLPNKLMVSETKLRFTGDDSIPFSHQQQIRAYCYMAGTLSVCYVSGHVSSRPPTALGLLRLLELTPLEAEETWAMIESTKQYLEEHGIAPVGHE